MRSGFGDGNAADEIALDIQRGWFPDYQHIVMVRKPSREYEALHPGIVTVERLEHYSFADAKGRNLRGFNYGDSSEIFNYLLEIVKKVSFVLIGHGAYFNTHHNSIARGNLAEMALLVWLAEMVGTPVVLTGMSASGLANVERWQVELMNWILKTVKGCIFRDSQSRLNLIDVGVTNAERWPVLPDALLSYPVEREPRQPEDYHRLLIAPRNVSHVSKGIDEQLTSTLVETAKRWLSEHTSNEVILIPQLVSEDPDDPNNDLDKCFGIHTEIHNERTTIGYNCHITEPWWEATLNQYSRGENLISVRHHASIFGILKGVKNIFPINYDDKVEGFWGGVFAQRPIPMTATADEIFEKIKSGHHYYPPCEPSEKIGMYYKEQIERFLGGK